MLTLLRQNQLKSWLVPFCSQAGATRYFYDGPLRRNALPGRVCAANSNGDARPLLLQSVYALPPYFFLIRPRFVSGCAHISLAARDFASQPGKRRSDVSLPGNAREGARASYAHALL